MSNHSYKQQGRLSPIVGRVRDAATLLFVPGNRPERFAKAAAAGADLVVLDLEDAVGPDQKEAARTHVGDWLGKGDQYAVRINAAGTPWHSADMAMVAQHDCAVMVAKAECVATVRNLATQLGEHSCLIALIETARGVMNVEEIASVPAVRRLAFGSFDLAAQLGVDPGDRTALASARSALVLASAAVDLGGPIDGVTGDLHDDALLTDDVRYARRLGFAGKLCVHPRQVGTAAAALRPTDEEVRWALSITDAAAADGVIAVHGQMIDKPVVDRAHRILRHVAKGNGDAL